ncbi:9921_t:CDS:1, partial [Racocetra persica]
MFGTKFQNQSNRPSWTPTVTAMLEGKRPWIRQLNWLTLMLIDIDNGI